MYARAYVRMPRYASALCYQVTKSQPFHTDQDAPVAPVALLISTAKSFQSFETYVVEGNVCFVFYVSLPMNKINRKHQMCAFNQYLNKKETSINK